MAMSFSRESGALCPVENLDTATYPNRFLWLFEKQGGVMAEADSRKQQDQLLANVKLVDPAATDEALVAAAKLGDHPAFWELWMRHSNRVFKTAYGITGKREDAEDVIQDTWIKAYLHLNTFDGRAKFSTWLTRIAVNSSLMILRRKRSHRETSMEITDGVAWQHWDIADRAKNAEELYAGQEEVERLRQAICCLRPTLRIVVEIRQSDDRSVQEIADLAGISVAATKARLVRATKILRKALS
ncbi:MAG TPA: sigma-70 family RNA polymerase sigma factor [Acidobacteriaceae bacterium]|jgi:RNA polymerase sigma-70 factor (ECF subfamily)|nr:sigma-70 family RNA polymerase sigma factor [Acidobacteriaceae bacterium]